jgi:predicted 3-demethylubiquinone-9 3-methyltransferase (glyoxalase superfamily)
MSDHILPFLMFEGRAEEAMTLYVSLFPDARIEKVERYGAAGPGKEGSVMRAVFSLGGQSIMCTDSFVKHAFTFTPATSWFVTCESEERLRLLAKELAKDGQVLMGLDNYGFSRLFTWVNDRFGVSWQLNLE